VCILRKDHIKISILLRPITRIKLVTKISKLNILLLVRRNKHTFYHQTLSLSSGGIALKYRYLTIHIKYRYFNTNLTIHKASSNIMTIIFLSA
jgi:hypothetical protein